MSERMYAVATGSTKDRSGHADEQIQLTWSEAVAWLDLDHPADHKDCGWHVFGTLSDLRRTKDTVTSRSAVALDADKAGPSLAADAAALGCAMVTHTTWSHTPEWRRYRLVLPLDRDVEPAEYRLIAGALMRQLGAEQFDAGSSEPERLMHRPSSSGVDYRSQVVEGPPLDTAAWLARAEELGLETAEPRTKEAADSCACEQADELHPWAAAAVRGELAKLDTLSDRPWAEGDRWDDKIFAVACNLREVANTPCYGYDLDQAERDFHEHAPTDTGWHTSDNEAKWESAERKVGDGQRPCKLAGFEAEAWSTDGHDDEGGVGVGVGGGGGGGARGGGGGGGGGKPPLAVLLREHVETRYDLFPAEDDGRVFAQAKAGGRAEMVDGGFVMRACRNLGRNSGTLSAAATEAAKVLTAHAAVAPPRRIALRSHHQPGRVVIDLAQHGSGRCVVVTADGWEVCDAPPPGVVFRPAGRPLPDPERGGDVDELRRVLRWGRDDPKWPLVKGWLACAPLAGMPRPLLGFFGPQGSAKSTTGRFVVGVLDPKPTGVLGSAFGKSRGDDEAKALANYLVAWDNVSQLSSDGADLLSRLVTGEMIEKRRLYTDADTVAITYRRTGVLTGISVPRGVKADTLDRLVLLRLDPLAERVTEQALEAEWAAAHPRVLAGSLDLTAAVLAGGGENPGGLRMGDYAEALWAADPALYRAYAHAVGEARADMAGDDPFIGTVLSWLRERGGEWEGTAGEAHSQAGRYHDREGWWPRSPRAFADAVTANLDLLREVGVTVEERRSHGHRLKRFTLGVRDDDRGQLCPEDEKLL